MRTIPKFEKRTKQSSMPHGLAEKFRHVVNIRALHFRVRHSRVSGSVHILFGATIHRVQFLISPVGYRRAYSAGIAREIATATGVLPIAIGREREATTMAVTL